MEITTLTVGELATHCYLVTDEETNKTIIIDPGDEGDFISSTILEKKLIPQAILLTHGHYDHCLATLELKLNFQIPIYLHPLDTFLYKKARLSAAHFSHTQAPPLPPVDFPISDNQTISLGSSTLKVIHTPGHTPGSCSFLVDHDIFTGDTLFASGHGSTDHAYSSAKDLHKSLSYLKSEISRLSSSPTIYPGHEDFGFLL